jgi:acyl-lipid omega-6 desaturase (Delta-12 desaturase)
MNKTRYHPDARNLVRNCASYGCADGRRSVTQVLTTAVPFTLLWVAMVFSLDISYWLTLLLAVPAAGLLVRFFIIQHDCGHGSFFKSRAANDLVGRITSVLTLTPYGYWRRTHGLHHATSGNLSRRGVGDIDTLTVKEYLALPARGRLAYRLYRNPAILFSLGAYYSFFLKHRLPFGLPLTWREAWRSIVATDILIAAAVAGAIAAVGTSAFFLVHGPIMMLAATFGTWLFYIQHQFDGAYWQTDERWSFHDAAIKGSSYYALPKVLQWFTGNIGLHHIHHLCSKIPNYRLQECLDNIPELYSAPRISLIESFKCARLALWDEDRGKLVGFRHLTQASRAKCDRPPEPVAHTAVRTERAERPAGQGLIGKVATRSPRIPR